MTVLFYPDPPVTQPGHSLSKTIRYFKILGYEVTNDVKAYWDIAVHWDYRDVNHIKEMFLDDNRLVLNMRLTDVTKSNVDKVFTKVFGYSSMANTDGFGYCIKKSERQAAHDGEFVKLPCEKEEGFIYQKVIDNRIDTGTVVDLRLPIFMGEIPLVFVKRKSNKGAFEIQLGTHAPYVDRVENHFTHNELYLISKFCKIIGLDIGELDVLRDNSSGKIYIVDVNNIPGSNMVNSLENGLAIEKELSLVLKSLLPEPVKIDNWGYLGDMSEL